MGNRGDRKMIKMCCFVHNIQELIQSNSGSTAKIKCQSLYPMWNPLQSRKAAIHCCPKWISVFLSERCSSEKSGNGDNCPSLPS